MVFYRQLNLKFDRKGLLKQLNQCSDKFKSYKTPDGFRCEHSFLDLGRGRGVIGGVRLDYFVSAVKIPRGYSIPYHTDFGRKSLLLTSLREPALLKFKPANEFAHLLRVNGSALIDTTISHSSINDTAEEKISLHLGFDYEFDTIQDILGHNELELKYEESTSFFSTDGNLVCDTGDYILLSKPAAR